MKRWLTAAGVIIGLGLLFGMWYIGSAMAQGPAGWWWRMEPNRSGFTAPRQPGMMGPGWGMMGGMMMHPPYGRGMMGRFGRNTGNPPVFGGENIPVTPPDDGGQAKSQAEVSYQADIQPIFDARCTACHGGTSGLFLTSYDQAMRGGVKGPDIIPGDPAQSRLIQYVRRGYMPLGGPPLSQAQIETLTNWVAAGAPNN